MSTTRLHPSREGDARSPPLGPHRFLSVSSSVSSPKGARCLNARRHPLATSGDTSRKSLWTPSSNPHLRFGAIVHPLPLRKNTREKKASSVILPGPGDGGRWFLRCPDPRYPHSLRPYLPPLLPSPSLQTKVLQKDPKIGFVAVRFLAFLFIYLVVLLPPSNA